MVTLIFSESFFVITVKNSGQKLTYLKCTQLFGNGSKIKCASSSANDKINVNLIANIKSDINLY
jgi:hypothetical protein